MAASLFGMEEDLVPLSQESDDNEEAPRPPKRFRCNSYENTNENNSSRSHNRDWETWNSDLLAFKLEEQGLKDVADIFKGT
jgi:hypothetical protein